MPLSRLPTVGTDTNIWGTVLNDWLTKTTADRQNVRVQGATGDGVTDDTAAFGVARDAAGVGGQVYVPPGVYVLSAFSWSVAGQTWYIVNGATLLLKPSSGTTELGSVNADGVTLVGDGVIDGNRAAQTQGVQRTLKINNQNCTIAGLTFQNSNAEHIFLNGNFSELVIRDCTMWNAGLEAIVSAGSTTNVYGVTILNNIIDQYSATLWSSGSAAPTCIHLWNTNYPSLSWTGVRIMGNYLRAFPYQAANGWTSNECVTTKNIDEYVISGNSIPNGGMGMSIVGGNQGVICGNTISGFADIGLEFASEALVTGNSFWDTDVNGTHTEVSLQCSQTGGTDIQIVGNHFYSVASQTGYTVQIWPASANDMSHFMFNDNVIRRLGGGTCIILNKALPFTSIQGNLFEGTGANVNWVDVNTDLTVYGLHVSGNIFANYGTGFGIRYGLAASPASPAIDYAIITNNIFRSGTTGLTTQGGATAGAHCTTTGNIGP